MPMTDTALPRYDVPRAPHVLRELFRREPVFAGGALCLAVLVLPTLAAMALDDRTLLDVSVWMKPLKFELSLIVYLATLCWFAAWLPKGVTETVWYRTMSVAVVLCIAVEMVWLIGAAGNGLASHFNTDTPLLRAAYPIMGMIAVFVTSATLVYAFLIWRDGESRLDPAFRLSVVSGLALTFVLTVAVASYMAGQGGHFVGGNLSDAEGMILTGWARDGGDLRVSHFFATHAMQFIPAFGLAASRTLRTRAASGAVVVFTIAFVGLVAYTFFEALSGRPFLAGLG